MALPPADHRHRHACLRPDIASICARANPTALPSWICGRAVVRGPASAGCRAAGPRAYPAVANLLELWPQSGSFTGGRCRKLSNAEREHGRPLRRTALTCICVRVHETAEDIEMIQGLLDRSLRRAGKNLRDVHSQGRHLSAAELSERLHGPRCLVVATVSSDCRPFTVQVDGTFYRGRFYFGVSDRRSLKARHLARNQAISATHVPNDNWVVTVHGRSERADVSREGAPGIHGVLVDTYKRRYGPEWTDDAVTSDSIYFRIDPDRMFALDLTEVRQANGA